MLKTPINSELSNCGGELELVAGGGFEPQLRIDSTQVIDSAIRENSTIGRKGKSLLHFFYTLPSVRVVSFEPLSTLPPIPRLSTQLWARIIWVFLCP